MKNNDNPLNLIKCDCGYNNKIEKVRKYGTCIRCGKVLDKKSKFKYEMFCKLHMWRYKRR